LMSTNESRLSSCVSSLDASVPFYAGIFWGVFDTVATRGSYC
jgi:hypothetical protein